jgi:hypothetical protein
MLQRRREVSMGFQIVSVERGIVILLSLVEPEFVSIRDTAPQAPLPGAALWTANIGALRRFLGSGKEAHNKNLIVWEPAHPRADGRPRTNVIGRSLSPPSP